MIQNDYKYVVRGTGSYEGAFEHRVFVRPNWVTRYIENSVADHDLPKLGVEVIVNGYRRHVHPAKEWTNKQLGQLYSGEMHRHRIRASQVRSAMRGVALGVGV